MAGAPRGNTNSSVDNRLWANTIRRAIVQGDAGKLRQIADKLIDMAAEGDLAAIKELGDRIDGKSFQTASVSVEHRVAESISEEHARTVAETFLESLRDHSGHSAEEAGGVHSSVSPGLPSSTATP
jgi:hypothetical protein